MVVGVALCPNHDGDSCSRLSRVFRRHNDSVLCTKTMTDHSATFTVVDTSRGTERGCQNRSEAEETKSDMVALGANPEDIEIYAPGETDGGVEAEIVDQSEEENPVQKPQDQSEDVPESPPTIDQDPVNWMPEHFVDEIQGVPTVNRKGYCVIAKQYGVSVTSEPVVRASESDFEFAEFEATAITKDGQTYTGFGSAHISRKDGDDPYLLNELAETRAMKRAVAWATGMGITAIEEMQNNL